jgi:hypothetical protein
MMDDRNEWKKLALAGTNLAVRSVEVAPHTFGARLPYVPDSLPPHADKEEVKKKLSEIENARQQP